MPAVFRTGVRVGVTRPAVFAVVAVALTLELVARVGVGIFTRPLYAVLLPPFFAVVALGGAFPVVRAEVAGDDAPWVAFPATVGAKWPSLLAFAAVGHLVAVAVGAALFLVGDTAVRFVLYALAGDHLPAGAAAALPAVGTAAGTIVAWSLLTPAVEPVLGRQRSTAGVRDGLRTAAVRAVESPRRTVALLGLHAVILAVVAGVVFAGVVYTHGTRSLLRLLLTGGGFALLAGTLLTQFVYTAHVAASLRRPPVTERADRGGGVGVPHESDAADGVTVTDLPVRRLAVAGLLCLSLVAGAGAVRMTETRPLDTSPEPLPEDPTAAYDVALENTHRSNHVFVATANASAENRTTSRLVALDRRHRRSLDKTVVASEGFVTRTTLYESSGVSAYDTESGPAAGSNASVRAFDTVSAGPAYWSRPHGTDSGARAVGLSSLPTPHTGEWTVVERGDGRLVVALEGEAAYRAAVGHAPPENASVESARVRMVLDTDRGVVSEGNATIRTVPAGTSNASETTARYDVQVDTPVRRPAALGWPSPAELAWRLFTY